MRILKHYTAVLLLIAVGCEGPIFDVPADEDSIPPTLTITYPADQSVLSDTVVISAYAFDNVELEQVTIYLNDSVVHESKIGPFEYIWPTTNEDEDEYYTIRAKAKDLAGNENYTNTIQVLVDNEDNVLPSGALIFPFTGQTLSGEVNIIIEANDNEGISSVTLFINGDSVAVFTEAPYTFSWNTTEEIDDIIYTIHAHVEDISLNQITLGPINITIDNYETNDLIPPTGNIIYPPSASTVSGDVEIQVSAFDNVQMGYVEFIIDGSLVNTDSVPPYNYIWNTAGEIEDADHVINVNLTDSAGNVSSLFPVTVFVDNIAQPDETPPTIVIYEPAVNQTVSGLITFKTIATDNVGIDRVVFYHNYEVIHTATSYPFNYEWDSNSIIENSEHIWFAKAYDNSGNSAQSQPMAIYLANSDDTPPEGIIYYPYPGQTVEGVIDISVHATDDRGISQVEFFINSASVGVDTQVPFSYNWNTNSADEDVVHILFAIIRDLSGNETAISPIAVTVNNDDSPANDVAPPVLAILSPLSSQTVTNVVDIIGFADDNDAIDAVEFFINDELIATDNDSPYVTIWNSMLHPNGSEHIIGMKARDLSGNESTAQPIFITVLNEYNNQVNNLSLTENINSIALSWNRPENANTFKVYRNEIFLIETSEQSYIDIVPPGNEFCYSVSAVNSVGLEGPQSTLSCGTALYPPAPLLSLSVDGNTAILNWSSVTDTESYRVYENGDFIQELIATTFEKVIETGVNTCFEVTSVNFYSTESARSNEECGQGL